MRDQAVTVAVVEDDEGATTVMSCCAAPEYGSGRSWVLAAATGATGDVVAGGATGRTAVALGFAGATGTACGEVAGAAVVVAGVGVVDGAGDVPLAARRLGPVVDVWAPVAVLPQAVTSSAASSGRAAARVLRGALLTPGT
ncbi:MAG: hypothetical protein ACXVXI_01865 [Mycobacteriaceae bacterium]